MTGIHGEQRQAPAGPRHGDIIEAALRVPVLAVRRRPIPTAVENDHVVELEALCPVCRQRAAGRSWRFRASRPHSASHSITSLRSVSRLPSSWNKSSSPSRSSDHQWPSWLPVQPAGDVSDPDCGAGTPPEPVDQTLGLAQAPDVRRIVGCGLDRDVPALRSSFARGLSWRQLRAMTAAFAHVPARAPASRGVAVPAHCQDRLNGFVLRHAQDLHATAPDRVEPLKFTARAVLPTGCGSPTMSWPAFMRSLRPASMSMFAVSMMFAVER